MQYIKQLEKEKEESYWKGYIQKQNEAMQICKKCKYREKNRKLEIEKTDVIEKLEERIKELDELKERYIKLKEYNQVDITLYKKREVENILSIMKGEKNVNS